MSEFLEIHKEAIGVLGFWTEEFRSSLIKSAELMYKNEVISQWHITDLVINGDKVLVKWNKRFKPLTEEELKEQYGR